MISVGERVRGIAKYCENCEITITSEGIAMYSYLNQQ